jgi:hypothetical protein
MKECNNKKELIQTMKVHGSLALQNVDVEETKHLIKAYPAIKLIEIADLTTSCYSITELYKSISRAI